LFSRIFPQFSLKESHESVFSGVLPSKQAD
jgi:hypothetical protein